MPVKKTFTGILAYNIRSIPIAKETTKNPPVELSKYHQLQRLN